MFVVNCVYLLTFGHVSKISNNIGSPSTIASCLYRFSVNHLKEKKIIIKINTNKKRNSFNNINLEKSELLKQTSRKMDAKHK